MAMKGIDQTPIVSGNIAIFPLTDGRHFLVDASDVELVRQFHWHAACRGRYVARNKKNEVGEWGALEYLHRYLMSPTNGLHVDHANGDGLDNRRSNLRLATRFENLRNQRKQKNRSSKFKGVTWHAARGKWRAQIDTKGLPRSEGHLGYFMSEEAAAVAYDAAAIRIFGEFARLNFNRNEEAA